MLRIHIEHNVSPVKLDTLAVDSWPVWSKEQSRFDWHYEQEEICYILEGEAIVTPENGTAVTITRGDLVHFPAGLTCVWEVTEPIEKHYTFK